MPYTAEHKAETRARIVGSARKLFNRRGFTDVSIDEIMAHAGLTRGGFYNHFATKDELYAEAITLTLQCEKMTADGSEIDFSLPPSRLSELIINAYLSDRHFQDVEESCPLVALPSDTARGGEPVRQAYRQVLEAMIRLFERSQDKRGDARQRAIAMATLCIGGMTLARAVDDGELSAEIRHIAKDTALLMGGWNAKSPTLAAE
ncbi:MAG: TetR/AcrR family transcriptional regulator [Hyphomicrobiaceae bacterium]|nr:TetR/AcrR family transcriptional regulator [Hyphomicrobiaceae bacterium]